MGFLLDLHLGWLNGWIPVVASQVVFGLLMLVFPKDVVARLYATSGWTRKQRLISLAGMPFALAGLGLDIFLLLKMVQPVLWIEDVIFVSGALRSQPGGRVRLHVSEPRDVRSAIWLPSAVSRARSLRPGRRTHPV